MRLRVIINPAAGAPEPVLATLNQVFKEKRGLDWDVAITTPARDASELASEAARLGCSMVAAYGGDGTISSVASGLVGTDVPLGVLPGGTNNVIAQALEIPLELAEAAKLLCVGPEAAMTTASTRRIDTLRVGERHGLIRVGVGADARMIQRSTREQKARYGWLAYFASVVEQVATATPAEFSITIDGREHTTDALTCVVSNIGRIGRGGMTLPGAITPFDGALDVLLIRRATLEVIRSIVVDTPDARPLPGLDEAHDAPLAHARGARVRIATTPAQPVQIDGDLFTETPVEVAIEPDSVRVITPRALAPR